MEPLPISNFNDFLSLFHVWCLATPMNHTSYVEQQLDPLVFSFRFQVGLYTWMIPLYVLGQGLRIWDLCEVRSLSQSDPGWLD